MMGTPVEIITAGVEYVGEIRWKRLHGQVDQINADLGNAEKRTDHSLKLNDLERAQEGLLRVLAQVDYTLTGRTFPRT